MPGIFVIAIAGAARKVGDGSRLSSPALATTSRDRLDRRGGVRFLAARVSENGLAGAGFTVAGVFPCPDEVSGDMGVTGSGLGLLEPVALGAYDPPLRSR